MLKLREKNNRKKVTTIIYKKKVMNVIVKLGRKICISYEHWRKSYDEKKKSYEYILKFYEKKRRKKKLWIY